MEDTTLEREKLAYENVFKNSMGELNADGRIVLNSLCKIAFSKLGVLENDSHRQAYVEGGRAIVSHIINMLSISIEDYIKLYSLKDK